MFIQTQCALAVVVNADFLQLHSPYTYTFRIQVPNMADLAAQLGHFSHVPSHEHLDKKEFWVGGEGEGLIS